MDPARMLTGSLTPGPELENSQDPQQTSSVTKIFYTRSKPRLLSVCAACVVAMAPAAFIGWIGNGVR